MNETDPEKPDDAFWQRPIYFERPIGIGLSLPFPWRPSWLRDDREFDPFIEAFSQAAGFNPLFHVWESASAALRICCYRRMALAAP